MKAGIITGATSGMGREFVLQVSRKYKSLDEIWVIGRRRERLEELQTLLGKKSKIRIYELDLTLDSDLHILAKNLEEQKPDVKLLINSAGFGKIGSFELNSYEDEIGMIDLNCRALTAVTYLILPYMKERARIIQMASVAAFLPQPYFAVYAASKSYVLSFSRALGYELAQEGITVTAVCPGPVDTEFFKIADPEDKKSSWKTRIMVKPKGVVSKALRDSAAGKDISIYGLPMKLVYYGTKILPHRFILKYIFGKIVSGK